MNIKILSLTENNSGKFNLILRINDNIERLKISIFDIEEVFGIESGEFEKILIQKIPTGKERQELIAAIKQEYLSLKKTSELQTA
ncbi:hypothetical protein BH20ACI1_BH20ACI1_00170 [soil metagenome]